MYVYICIYIYIYAYVPVQVYLLPGDVRGFHPPPVAMPSLTERETIGVHVLAKGHTLGGGRGIGGGTRGGVGGGDGGAG